MLSSISNLIGGQTGVNSGQLLVDLVAAARAPRDEQYRERLQLNQSRISALASATAALETFSTALSDLLNGRGFAGELVSSRTDLAAVDFIDGKLPESLPATVEIVATASAQRLVSAVAANGDAPVGEGTLTLTTPRGSFALTIDATNNSLAGLRDAINNSASGVTATILTDKNGARLVLEGQEGLDNTFTLTGGGTGVGLDAYAYPPAGGAGFTQVAAAADSVIRVDGIELINSSNQLDNAIPGVRLNLLTSAPGTTFTISGSQPTQTVRDLVLEFVKAYNDLRTGLNEAVRPGAEGGSGGPLAGDRGVRDMIKALGRLSSTPLAADGPYRTLADIGVKTNNDGTLVVDTVRLDAALEADPLAVSRMLEPPTSDAANPGLAGALEAIKTSLTAPTGSLTIAKNRLDAIAKDLAELREKIDEDSERYREQLARTFTAMDRQLAVLRSTQSYVEQQISIWNQKD